MRKSTDDSLKKELDKGNNFVDYFTIIGIKRELIFEDFLYENDINTLNSSERINPEILTKFPPFDKTTINIDENMIRVSIFFY
jgi:hypothetical protein